MGLVDHAIAQGEVSMEQFGEGLQQDLGHDCGLEEGWVELIQFQHSEIGLQAVGLLLGLCLRVALQGGQVLRIVSFDPLDQLTYVFSHLLKHHHGLAAFTTTMATGHSTCRRSIEEVSQDRKRREISI